MAIYLPFGIALNPVSGVDLASVRVFILVIFLIWIFKGLADKKLEISASWQTACILSFLFLNFISIFFAQEASWGARKFLFLLTIVPIYFVAADVIKNRLDFEKVLKYFLFGGIIAAGVGIIQFTLQFLIGLDKIYAAWADISSLFLGKNLGEAVLNNPSWLVNISGNTVMRAVSIFPDPHMFSFYLGMLAPLALYFFLEGNSLKTRLFYGFSLFAILSADLLTFSRGGYLGILGGAVFLVAYNFRKIKFRWKFVLVSLVGVFILVNFFPNPVTHRFLSSFNLTEGSNQGRIFMWQKAIKVAAENPFFGVGLGNFPLEVKAQADYRDPITAHNTYLDIGAETGLFSLFFWVALLIVSIINFLKYAKFSKIGVFAAASLIIFAAHSIFETGLYSIQVLTLVLVLAALSNVKINNQAIVIPSESLPLRRKRGVEES